MNIGSLGHQLNIARSSLTTALRIGAGISSVAADDKPAELLELYDFEGCPYCRLVREVLTELDLDALVYPCPKRGERFRPRVAELGGKLQFPFLVDPNTGRQMYESLDIIAYLYETYARRPPAVEVARRVAAKARLRRFGHAAGIRRDLVQALPRTIATARAVQLRVEPLRTTGTGSAV